MKEILSKIYKETKVSHRNWHPSVDDNNIRISFIEGAKVEIFGDVEKEYVVDFFNNTTNVNIYSTKIKTGMWCAPSIRHFLNWRVTVKSDNEIIKEEIFDPTKKKVKVTCDTNSIGDLLAYIGPINEFQKKYNCELNCVVFNSQLYKIFKENYPNINFLSTTDSDSYYYASYRLGFYYEDWHGKNSTDPKKMALSTIASDILGFGDIEIKPKLKVNKPNNNGKKYVCIGVHSTAQLKYWNRENGWNQIVKYLNSIDIEVWCIDRFKYFGNDKYQNKIPEGVIDKTGDFPLEERMSQIAGAEFFIGLSSGLSWLAWSIGTPVIMISGMGEVWTEFYNPFRIEPIKSVCNSCTNEFPFDKSKWDWCPRNKNFECTREISPEMVIEKINKILDKDYLKSLEYIEEDPSFTVLEKFSVYNEFFKEKYTVYEKFFKVEENDVVVDIGGFLGWFSYSASKKNPKKIFILEPGASRQEKIKNKLHGSPYTLLNVGIADKREFIKNGLNFRIIEDFNSITFSDFIKENKIDKIDFLKMDCEGGEYSVFTDENFDWITKNVKKIAGEWHHTGPVETEKFINFRDKFLSKFKNYRVYDTRGLLDLTKDIYSPDFFSRCTQTLIYIDVRDGLVNDDKIFLKKNDSRILITGISGGLGQSLESECISRNILFFGHSNKNEKYRLCDFSNIENVSKMEEYISKNNINCLINNAGVYCGDPLTELSDQKIQEILNVNLLTPILLSKYLYKHLVSTKQTGWIININSLAGKYPNYNESVYCASKFGLSGFGSSISINQKNSNIKVVDVYVGAMKTKMTVGRPNYSDLMDPKEISSFIIDIIENKAQYVPSSIEIRNSK